MEEKRSGKEEESRETRNPEELIVRLQEGDPNSLDDLYQRYQGSVYAMCVRILGCHYDAEEVVQETFLHVWRKSLAYDRERGALSTWIMTIGRSRALDRIRKRKRFLRNVSEVSIAERVRPKEPSPEDDVIRQEESNWVMRAMKTLDIPFREVVKLAYFRGMSHVEIASESSLSLGTVKWRLRVGKERLGKTVRRHLLGRRQLRRKEDSESPRIRAAG